MNPAPVRPAGLAGRLSLTAGRVALVAIPLAILALFFVLPVSGMVARGLWVEGRFDVVGVQEVLARPRVHRVLWFTLWSSGAATACSIALGIPVAYVCYRLAFPGRRVLRAVVLVPFVLPSVVVGVAFRQLLAGPLAFLGVDASAAVIVAALTFFNIAVVVRTVGSAWESLDRRPGEAAAALGASPSQVLRTVTLPALRPAILASASVVFLFCATAFGVVLMLGGLRYATVETEIYLLTTNLLDLRAAAALSLLQLLIVTALLLGVRRLDLTPTATQERAPAPPGRVSRNDLPALSVAVVAAALVMAPVLTLVVGSLRSSGEWSLVNYRTLTGGAEVGGISVVNALVTSLRVAVDATWLSLGLGLAVAVAVSRPSRTRRERTTRSLLDGLFALPLGVSAVTVGFGFLITLDQPPLDLRDHPLLVPVAQALVALPLVVRTLAPVLAGIDVRRRQAAASLGANPWQASWVVEWPVLRRPLAAAAGFAFAVSLGEFGATSFLARDERPTLPVVIFRLLGQPGELNYGTAMAAAVLLAGVTAAVVVAVEQIEGRSATRGAGLR